MNESANVEPFLGHIAIYLGIPPRKSEDEVEKEYGGQQTLEESRANISDVNAITQLWVHAKTVAGYGSEGDMRSYSMSPSIIVRGSFCFLLLHELLEGLGPFVMVFGTMAAPRPHFSHHSSSQPSMIHL